MDRDLARRAHELLTRASELAPGERVRFLTEACGNDTGLRSRLDALIAALDRSETDFLETPALAAYSGETSAIAPAEPKVDKVGSYCVLRVLGAGGMATVYEAEQQHPRRRVAVKVMRQALLHTAAIERFRYETEVLARLHHPAIAQIYEAGTWQLDPGPEAASLPTGNVSVATPFFAMEFIPEARPLTRYCREECLPREARIALFLDICDAVQHGHQLGIIHRDLKPANLLVGADGRPKVIDFGVARSADPDQAWITSSADHDQLVGTLNYMSPEQCTRRGPIDTRCDVYSLGVVLHELLCDRLPYDLSGVPLPEAVRIIREDIAPRPSTVDPALRGDLDAIVMTATAKEPDRRYRTVAALAADLRRSLASLPIEARPPTLAYQAKLFARRNRAAVVAAALVAVAVVVGSAASVTFAVRERREGDRRRAAEVAALAQLEAALQSAYIANVAAGFSAYQVGELQQVRTQLASAPVHLRGWEWRFLKGASERSIRSFRAHEDMIFDLAVSPDATRFATVGRDSRVRLWDAEGNLLADLVRPGGEITNSVVFDPTGQRLAVGFEDGTIRIWSVTATTDPPRVFKRHSSRVTRLAWPAAGSDILASASLDGQSIAWNLRSGQLVREFTKVGTSTPGIATSPDRSRLITWDRSGVVRVLRADAGEVLFELPFGEPAEYATMSPDNLTVVVGGSSGRLGIWSLTDHSTRREVALPGTSSSVRHLCISPDGTMLAASLTDRNVHLVSLTTDTATERLVGHEEAVSRSSFSPDGRTLVSVSWDGTFRTWGLTPDSRTDFVRQLSAHDGQVLSVVFTPDAAVIASGGRDGLIRLSDPDLGEPFATLHGHESAVSALAISHDGKLLASGSYDRTVRLWDTATGTARPPLADHDRPIWTVAFSPDGSRLASAGDDTVVRIWDVEAGKVLRRLPSQSHRVNTLAFSPDGHTLATGLRNGAVRLWDTQTGRLLRTLEGHRSDVFAVLFSPDGSRLFSGARDQTVRIWDVTTGKPLDTLDGHGQFITSLALSPDGSRLAAGSWFGQVLLWDVPSLRLVASIKAQTEVIRSIAMSPDGRWLAVACADGVVRLLDAAEPQMRLRAHADAVAAREAAAALLDAPALRSLTPADALRRVEGEARMSPATYEWVRRFTMARTTTTRPSTRPRARD